MSFRKLQNWSFCEKFRVWHISLFKFWTDHVYISGKTALVRRYTEGNCDFSLSPFIVDSTSRFARTTRWHSSTPCVRVKRLEERHPSRSQTSVIRISSGDYRADTYTRRRRNEIRKQAGSSAQRDTCALKRCARAAAAARPPLIRTPAPLHTETVFCREVLLELQDYHRRRFCDKILRLGSAH